MDVSGRPIGQQVAASSGDAAFDAEVMRATAELRTDPGRPQRGCVYNWYRRGAVLPAPPMPSAPADPRAACPSTVLASYRALTSPGTVAPFLDRGVEGWALVRFDIAPWGEVGKVEVIDAQPASAFGETARRIVGAGRAEPGPGAIRCVQPVVFRVPADD
jgi:TonB family protein